MLAIPLTATLASVSAVSLVAVVIAWRGRRSDDHPLCGRCGFDLTGKPSESDRCAECGASLTRSRAIRIGNRQRQTRPLILAVLVVLTCGSIGGVRGWRAARTVKWEQYEPTWLLVRQADWSRPSIQDAALAEIVRRIGTGNISPAREEALVERALMYQADQGRPWVSGWGDLVQAVHNAGRLPPEQWTRYELDAVQLAMKPTATALRKCDPFEFVIVHGPDRVGHECPDDEDEFISLIYSDQWMKLGRHVVQGWFDEDIRYWAIRRPDNEGCLACCTYEVGLDDHAHTLFTPVLPNWSADLGLQTAEMTLVLRPTSWQRMFDFSAKLGLKSGPYHTAIERKVKLRCDWLAAASPIVADDESIRKQVEKSLSITDVKVVPCPWNSPRVDGWRFAATVIGDRPPVDLAFSLIAHDPSDKRSWWYDMGTVFLPRRKQTRVFIPNYDWYFGSTPYASKTVDIALKPKASASPVGTNEIWGGEILLKGIRVRPSEKEVSSTDTKSRQEVPG